MTRSIDVAKHRERMKRLEIRQQNKEMTMAECSKECTVDWNQLETELDKLRIANRNLTLKYNRSQKLYRDIKLVRHDQRERMLTIATETKARLDKFIVQLELELIACWESNADELAIDLGPELKP